MQFWGDIIGNHPELIPEIPKDVIALEWGYEAGHPFGAKCQSFAETSIPFYVCPGTSSWNSLGGRIDNAVENIRNAVEKGIQFGAEGMLVTDWGDNGHWQQLPISYPGLAYAAGVSWGYRNNKDMEMAVILDNIVFEDQAGILGQAIIDLGNIYQKQGLIIPNNSILFLGLLIPIDRIQDEKIQEQFKTWTGDQEIFIQRIQETKAKIDQISSTIGNYRSDRFDAELIRDEIEFTTRVLHHATERLLALRGVESIDRQNLDAQLEKLQTSFRQTWLKRNRPGGLEESILYMTGELSPPDMPTWESILNLYARSKR